MPSPASRPSPEARAPMVSASTTTEPRTCRRVPPRARSRAASRLRWAMRIVKVLEIDSVATRRAMPAKTTRMLRRVVRKVLLTSVTACWVAAAPVRASTPGGSTRWIRVAISA